MIRIEIVGQTIADFREKVEALFVSLGIGGQPPSTPYPTNATKAVNAGPVVVENYKLDDPLPPEASPGRPVESKKRRAAKGAGSEPEVVEAKISEAIMNAVPVAEREAAPEVTAAMVRESLLALLPDGKGNGVSDEAPEEVLAEFDVKRVKDLTPEQFAAVKAAADKRLKAWQDAKK